MSSIDELLIQGIALMMPNLDKRCIFVQVSDAMDLQRINVF